jgi:ABC-type hemin transport system ATPase subunit
LIALLLLQVITIAHRLHTVCFYDRIMVMDAGAVAEQGTPQELLSRYKRDRCMDRSMVVKCDVSSLRPSGMFRTLAEESGDFENLVCMASES